MSISRDEALQADVRLQHAEQAFDRSAQRADVAPAPALAATVGLLRALAGLVRFCVELLREAGGVDPVHLQPRILRAD